MEICALCGEEKKLCKSHIIPKFVFDWIKKTSATGYLRQISNINKRIQDCTKEELLCIDCETKFSRYERYFADKIFYPYLIKDQKSFDYDETLQKFLISVSWRLLKKDLEGFKKFQPEMAKYAEETEQYWKEILLNDNLDEKYEHHMLLLDCIEENNVDNPKDFNIYVLRGTDGTLVSDKTEVYLFIKFPSILFISSIYPKSVKKNWENTLIEKSGTIGKKTPVINDPKFGSFLLDRVNLVTESKLSTQQNKKIEKTMLKDLNKVKNSKSYELYLKNRKY
jgi:hypothetical protein